MIITSAVRLDTELHLDSSKVKCVSRSVHKVPDLFELPSDGHRLRWLELILGVDRDPEGIVAIPGNAWAIVKLAVILPHHRHYFRTLWRTGESSGSILFLSNSQKSSSPTGAWHQLNPHRRARGCFVPPQAAASPHTHTYAEYTFKPKHGLGVLQYFMDVNPLIYIISQAWQI